MTDADSVQDTDLADSVVEPDEDETDHDADVDEAWERDVEIPDMNDNPYPYWEEYSLLLLR